MGRDFRGRNDVARKRISAIWIGHHRAEARKISGPDRGGGHGSQLSLSLEFPQPFEVHVKEGAVFPDRTAGSGAELVANVLRPVGAVEEVAGIQVAVPQVIVKRSEERRVGK